MREKIGKFRSLTLISLLWDYSLEKIPLGVRHKQLHLAFSTSKTDTLSGGHIICTIWRLGITRSFSHEGLVCYFHCFVSNLPATKAIASLLIQNFSLGDKAVTLIWIDQIRLLGTAVVICLQGNVFMCQRQMWVYMKSKFYLFVCNTSASTTNHGIINVLATAILSHTSDYKTYFMARKMDQ